MRPRVALTPDHQLASQLLPEVSRTFALSIEQLPDGLRDAVKVGYLLCRIVDTIEDEPGLAWDARARLFDAFDVVVEHDHVAYAPFERLGTLLTHASEAEAKLAQQAGAVFRLFRALPPTQREALRPHVLEMSAGMREYALRADREGALRVPDVADLERYAGFVAGTVGHLLTALFLDAVGDLPAATRACLRSHATSFGVGLQLVNILKDVAEDAERGVCFLPEADLAEAGLTRSDLLRPESREAALGVLSTLAARARGHLDRADVYTRAWPAGAGAPMRRFCALPLALAHATLTELVQGDDALRGGRSPRVPRELVLELMMASYAVGDDDEALATFLARARAWQPLEEA